LSGGSHCERRGSEKILSGVRLGLFPSPDVTKIPSANYAKPKVLQTIVVGRANEIFSFPELNDLH